MSTVEDDLHIEDARETGGAVPSLSRRAPRISQADVFAAADALLVEGHRPTIDRVRMRLGRGSPNTINDHLDTWWMKLGARLRDLPGQEFPQLPERVAHILRQLWTEALDGARAVLKDALQAREHALDEGEEALAARVRTFADQEQTLATRAIALEEALTLAREQLQAANQRAQTLEDNLHASRAEGSRLRSRVEALEGQCAQTRTQLDAAITAHQGERGQLQARHAAAEQHWLLEVDRARQEAKKNARELDRQTQRLDVLAHERDEGREKLLEARAELKTAAAVREQLEQRLRTVQETARTTVRHAGPSPRAKGRRPQRKAAGTGSSE